MPSLKSTRRALGLSQRELERAILLQNADAGRTVRHWELGTRPISGPGAIAVALLALGKPELVKRVRRLAQEIMAHGHSSR